MRVRALRRLHEIENEVEAMAIGQRLRGELAPSNDVDAFDPLAGELALRRIIADRSVPPLARAQALEALSWLWTRRRSCR